MKKLIYILDGLRVSKLKKKKICVCVNYSFIRFLLIDKCNNNNIHIDYKKNLLLQGVMDVLSLSGLKWKSYTMTLVILHLFVILCEYDFFYTLPKTLHKHLQIKGSFLVFHKETITSIESSIAKKVEILVKFLRPSLNYIFFFLQIKSFMLLLI